ncbi:MAG: META domain-containing protein [Chloroflexi bacterium]|nr:META domain-containing protein [Chloroflexota bacterium]MBI3167000.1 META domain-containing protein [Chloroflexota bacterium]
MKLATFPALALLALAMVMFNACSNATPNLTGEWKLVSYGNATNPTPALPGVDTTISFNEGQFGGTVGCNTFGGDYQVNGNQITIDSIVSTLMFCTETSAQESAVLTILSNQALNISLSGSQLTLSSQNGASVVVFERK